MVTLSFDPEKDIPDLSGKVIFVTGGTAGLGASTTLQLAAHNPSRIYISGRPSSASKAEAVATLVKNSGSTTTIHFIALDLANLSTVRAAAETFLSSETRLDILIANAGIMATPPGLTTDGYEVQFGTNHMGHALLVKKLLPLLRRTATNTVAGHSPDVRIILLTSLGFQFARGSIPFSDLKTTQDGPMGPWMRYGRSKLANILYARELAKRYPEILSVSIHPGTVKTGLVGDLSWGHKAFVYVTNLGRMLEPEMGAWNTCWAVGVERGRVRNGGMYEPVGVESRPLDDEELAGRLFEWTERELEGF